MSAGKNTSERWDGPRVNWGTPDAVKAGVGIMSLFGPAPGDVVEHRLKGTRATVLGYRHAARRRDWVVLRWNGRTVEVPAGEFDRTWRSTAPPAV